MANKVLDYLKNISGNAAALKEFHINPAESAKKAGLTPAEVTAVISKNPGAISQAIRTGGGINANDDINVTIVVVVAP